MTALVWATTVVVDIFRLLALASLTETEMTRFGGLMVWVCLTAAMLAEVKGKQRMTMGQMRRRS